MRSTVQIVEPPASEPVDLETVRLHCRIDQSADDAILSGYARTARTRAEMYLSRALITQTLLWILMPESRLPDRRHRLHCALELPRAPVQSVASVTVLDVRGNTTEIAPATLPLASGAPLLGYRLDLAQTPSRLVIGPETVMSNGYWFRHTDIENIQVEFVAGYSDPTTIPQPIIDGILLWTGFLYEHRGDSGGDMPKAAEWLFDPYRLMWVS